MIICIKDLYDYHLVRKSYKCRIITLKSNFHKKKTKSDGLNSNCITCRKQYYEENS